MENRAHALIAGLFVVLIGAGILVTFWWFAGGGEEFKNYQLVTHTSVTGLNPQAAVRFQGVRVGRVLDIALDDDDSQKVIVTIRVRSDVPITRGTHAALASQGITGNSYVVLRDEGKDPRPLEGVGKNLPEIALQPGVLDQAVETGREILGQLKESTTRLNKMLSEKNIASVEATLKNLAASTAHLEQTLAQTPLLVKDMRRFASAENAERLSSAMTELQTASKQLGPIIANWNRAVAKIDAAGGRIDRLGAEVQTAVTNDTLPRVNQLATELQTTSAQLNRVLDEIQRTPQMLLLGRQPAQLGPGEAATGQDKK